MMRFALALALLLATFSWNALAQAPSNIEALRAVALEAVNADRFDADLDPLRPDAALDEAAQAHARDMLRRDYFAHVSPDGTNARDRFLAAGGSRFVVVGENIETCTGCAAPDAERVRAIQRSWMGSPEHRRNILARGYDRFGYGISFDGRRQYAVQTFSGVGGDGGEPVDATAAQALALDAINAARQASKLEGSDALREALAATASMDAMPSLDAVFERLGGGWSRLALLSATCGGCGSRATGEDVARFVRQWAENDRLGVPATDLGFVILADGQGRLRAFALLGTRR